MTERIEIYLSVDEEGDVSCAFSDYEVAKENCEESGTMVKKTSMYIRDVKLLIEELQDFI